MVYVNEEAYNEKLVPSGVVSVLWFHFGHVWATPK